jgi:hypothetical protein
MRPLTIDKNNAVINLGLFRHFQGIIDFYTQVPYRAFQFGMPQQQLYRPKILCPSINQRGFGAPK